LQKRLEGRTLAMYALHQWFSTFNQLAAHLSLSNTKKK
jgi:hypothetical protein